ncbi:hypothetical protein V6N11_039396 [Hibiscus sabdariffa]|uniref:Uncharacterized protein n=1 Tax=Hibiscus sabdariffa TaxID=183260 RepID=A0ABR2SNL3_9ROSI
MVKKVMCFPFRKTGPILRIEYRYQRDLHLQQGERYRQCQCHPPPKHSSSSNSPDTTFIFVDSLEMQTIDEVIELEVGMDKFDVLIVEITFLRVVCGNGKASPGSKPEKKANPVVVESSSESTTDSDHRVNTINSGDNYLGTDDAFTECIEQGFTLENSKLKTGPSETDTVGNGLSEALVNGGLDDVNLGHNKAMEDVGFMGFKNNKLIKMGVQDEEADI